MVFNPHKLFMEIYFHWLSDLRNGFGQINCHQSSDLNFSCKFLVKGVPVFFLNFPLEGSIKHFMVFYRNTNCTQVRD